MRNRVSSSFLIPALLLMLGLAGCTSPEYHRLMARTIAPASDAQIAGEHRIFLATTRAKSDQDGLVFSGDRTLDPYFAFVDVTVPKVHEAGNIERAVNPVVADPARYFTARRLGIFRSRDDYRDELAREIRQRGGRAMVFVHGYNTAFDDAVYRMTQVAHDSGYPGAVVLFTWPSAGRVVDYLYDQNSAMASRDALEDMLRLVAEAGAERIDLIAHSMGSLVTMEALRQLAMSNDADLNGRLADVILASPDIDADVFKTQKRRLGSSRTNFVVLASRNDRALGFASFLSGSRERVGAILNAEELAEYGVTVVDVTALSAADSLNHTKFAENPVLVKLLGVTLTREDTIVNDRTLSNQLSSITGSIGQTVGNAAGIIITTPFRVFELAL
ncbi:alpha/beta hydrolase [Nitratireductor aestuarii]|nr:alpha/beta hydrolase [Nitratireductor aestuarii]